MIDRYQNLPAHIRASHTPEERAYYQATYDEPRLGPEWATAHRKIEMTVADIDRRDFFLGYWPQEALSILEEFKDNHYEAEPDKNFSTLGERLRKYYPKLFSLLDTRMAGLSDATDTHPQLLPLWRAYQSLKASYMRKLTAADKLTSHLADLPRRKRRHEHYRVAFEAVYPDLKRLIESLIELGR